MNPAGAGYPRTTEVVVVVVVVGVEVRVESMLEAEFSRLGRNRMDSGRGRAAGEAGCAWACGGVWGVSGYLVLLSPRAKMLAT